LILYDTDIAKVKRKCSGFPPESQPFQGVKNKLLKSGCYRQFFLMLSAGGLLQKPPDIAELR